MRTFPPDGTTFAQVQLGQRLSQEIPAYGYWNMQFYQSRAAFVSFDWSFPRGASIGVYARRNALPTHTHYDIIEVLSGFKPRQTRSTHVSSLKFQIYLHNSEKSLNHQFCFPKFIINVSCIVPPAGHEKRSQSLPRPRALVPFSV